MIKPHQNIELLRRLFPIPNFDQNNIAHWDQLHQSSIQSIVKNGGALSDIPPFEKHPYIEPLDVI